MLLENWICFVFFKERVDKGELLFSLQFLPTSCRLTIAVLKAKDLKFNGEDTDLGEYAIEQNLSGGSLAFWYHEHSRRF